MFDRLRTLLLRFLRVPPEPEPPIGAPGSVRVFRAAMNYYRLRLLGWGLTQVGALLGIVISLYFLGRMEKGFHELAAEVQSAATNEVSQSVSTNESVTQTNVATDAGNRKSSTEKSEQTKRIKKAIARWSWVPTWVFSALSILEVFGFGIYAVQACMTYALLRLDYELRWYIVTDRSLRIRSGIWSVQELTMSFANLQQVAINQGPLQRLLGIADVRVQSAGGGGGSTEGHPHGSNNLMHTGAFRGVDNASEVRDLILNRLRHFRETGLGDPDERSHSLVPGEPAAAPVVGTNPNNEVLAAARELLAEARQLRTGMGRT